MFANYATYLSSAVALLALSSYVQPAIAEVSIRRPADKSTIDPSNIVIKLGVTYDDGYTMKPDIDVFLANTRYNLTVFHNEDISAEIPTSGQDEKVVGLPAMADPGDLIDGIYVLYVEYDRVKDSDSSTEAKTAQITVTVEKGASESTGGSDSSATPTGNDGNKTNSALNSLNPQLSNVITAVTAFGAIVFSLGIFI